MKSIKTIKREAAKLYYEKGLNSVHAYLKRNKIPYTQKIYEFGGYSEKNLKKQSDFINPKELKFYYFPTFMTNRHNGFNAKYLRGTEIILDI